MKSHSWRIIGVTLLGLLAVAQSSGAQEEENGRRVYFTNRAGTPPQIDGRLDDPAWSSVEWSGDFVQRDPSEGEPPSAQTSFKILYDQENLYVAYRAYDPEPDKIANILSRRDHFPGDWVEINIDSLHDLRTAFSFTASVSGTQGDEFISDDGNRWDGNWDPIWEHRARIDDEGWTAEARIPLSQLRYPDREQHVWGIQVQRRIYRQEERSTWQQIPKEEDGWVSKFGELRGITGIRPLRRIELMPYGVTRAERFEKIEGDPFHDGSSEHISAGLDGKLGITGDLTLDFTINPDFGQVEADPSEVNLSAFEPFFDERRPFFIEGSNILNFRLAPSYAWGSHTMTRLFYSRRIGRAPHYRADWYEDGYVDQPDNTTILGAAKLSGKTAGGVSVAILESVTSEESATIELDGERRDLTVEPLTNYFIGRVQRDYREGRTQIGGMLTAVNRRIEDDHLDYLHDAAYAGGVDVHHAFHGRAYYVAARVVGSTVRGSEDAILRTQSAPARYYQRPDNPGQAIDSTLTSLDGHAGSIMIGKGEGNLMAQLGMAWRSPGSELNDVGYLRNTDEINQFFWAGYRIRNTRWIFRNVGFNVNQWLDFEYDGGENLYQALNFNGHGNFTNNWNFDWSATRQNERISVHELRGGRSMKRAGAWDMNANLNTDWRQPISFHAGSWGSAKDDGAGQSNSYWGGVRFRPRNAMTINLSPSFSRSRSEFQYVTTLEDDEIRYIYADINRKTFNVEFRVDLALSPRLTVQYYGAPFVSAGEYSDFKRVTSPRADSFEDRFIRLADGVTYDESTEVYSVDEDGDTVADYSFDKPDFNVRDFNSNLVVRWEWSPGSSIYLVWQQARFGYAPTGEFALREDLDGLFGVHPHNIFLIKVSKWFNL